jgi:hypothetical protein
MTQTHQPPPSQQTERVERVQHQPGGFEPPGERSSAGRTAAVVLMLVAVTLIAAGTGYLLAGGRLSFGTASSTPAAPTAAATAPDAPAAGSQAGPTTPQAPTAVPKPESTAPPAPTAAPTGAPAAAKPAAPEATPTTPAKPTAPPPPAAKPAGAPPAGQQGEFVPVRPGTDPRMAQIEGRINEYFAALNAEDYARAHAVCCTEAWRARYPLERWQHNFDGVTDLRLTNPPRYLRIEDNVVVVDTDYTFVSGGARRNFTVRWTFTPVGSEWQAELAEAFPQQSSGARGQQAGRAAPASRSDDDD